MADFLCCMYPRSARRFTSFPLCSTQPPHAYWPTSAARAQHAARPPVRQSSLCNSVPSPAALTCRTSAASSRPALWTLCLPEEGKTDATRQGLLEGLLSQGVAEHARHGTALLFLRRQVTGNTPPRSGEQGISGPQAGATTVADATNVAPSQTWLGEWGREMPGKGCARKTGDWRQDYRGYLQRPKSTSEGNEKDLGAASHRRTAPKAIGRCQAA